MRLVVLYLWRSRCNLLSPNTLSSHLAPRNNSYFFFSINNDLHLLSSEMSIQKVWQSSRQQWKESEIDTLQWYSFICAAMKVICMRYGLAYVQDRNQVFTCVTITFEYQEDHVLRVLSFASHFQSSNDINIPSLSTSVIWISFKISMKNSNISYFLQHIDR